MPATVVSLTTIPSRIRFLGVIVEHLLDQSLTEFELRIHLPRACARRGEPYVVPHWLESFERDEPRLSLRRTDNDYGPATKLLGSLCEPPPADDACVITVDDDVLLERHALEELIEASARFPGDALGFMGVTGDRYVHAEQLSVGSSVTRGVLGGYRGVLYPWRCLDESLFEDLRAVSDQGTPFLDDDHLIAWNLARRGVTRRVIPTRHPGLGGRLNAQLLRLPDPLTLDEPGAGRSMNASHQALRRLYRRQGWPIPG